MSSTRRISLAVMASCSLFVAALALAPAATPLLLLVPLPGLVLAANEPGAEYLLWGLLTTGVVAGGLGLQAVPEFVLSLGLPTMMLAIAIRRSWALETTVLASLATWTAGIIVLLLITYESPAAVVAAAHEQLESSVNLALSAYGSLGITESALATLRQERAAVVRALLGVLPAMVVLTGGLIVLLNLVIVRSWTTVFRSVNLRLWRTPDPLIWALIISGFSIFAPIAWVALVGTNLFIVILGCYFCQGLAIVSYYLDRFRLPRGVRLAGYILIGVQHIIAAMVLALGVFDMWGNFRRIGAVSGDIELHSGGD